MTIADFITKRDLQRNANFFLWVLRDHVMQISPFPIDIDDEEGWDQFVTSVEIVKDIDQIIKVVMK